MFSLCNQTVTVYSAYQDKDGQHYHRTVIRGGAFLDYQRRQTEKKGGAAAKTGFLLVIPQGADRKTFLPYKEFAERTDKSGFFTLRPGDKVCPGEGGAIVSPQEWAALLPSSGDGVVVVQEVRLRRGLDGRLSHIEAL